MEPDRKVLQMLKVLYGTRQKGSSDVEGSLWNQTEMFCRCLRFFMEPDRTVLQMLKVLYGTRQKGSSDVEGSLWNQTERFFRC